MKKKQKKYLEKAGIKSEKVAKEWEDERMKRKAEEEEEEKKINQEAEKIIGQIFEKLEKVLIKEQEGKAVVEERIPSGSNRVEGRLFKRLGVKNVPYFHDLYGRNRNLTCYFTDLERVVFKSQASQKRNKLYEENFCILPKEDWERAKEQQEVEKTQK